MPVQALAYQALHSCLGRYLITQCYLVFYNNVNRRVSLLVWRLDAGFAMVLHHESYALVLIHGLPLVRVGRIQRIVIFHSSVVVPGSKDFPPSSLG